MFSIKIKIFFLHLCMSYEVAISCLLACLCVFCKLFELTVTFSVIAPPPPLSLSLTHTHTLTHIHFRLFLAEVGLCSSRETMHEHCHMRYLKKTQKNQQLFNQKYRCLCTHNVQNGRVPLKKYGCPGTHDVHLWKYGCVGTHDVHLWKYGCVGTHDAQNGRVLLKNGCLGTHDNQ